MPKGVRIHALSDIDEDRLTGICRKCGPVEIRKKIAKSLTRGFMYECREKRREEARIEGRQKRRTIPASMRKYKGYQKGDKCERCGFLPEDPCQLEVDHILPRWKGGTNEHANLQTLCANCHSLKTKKDVEEYNAWSRSG